MHKQTTADALMELSPYLKFMAQRLQRSAGPRLFENKDFDPALTTKEAAEYTGLHEKTLLEDARSGEVAFIRRSENGRLRFRLSDLNKYLDSQRTQPSTQKSSDAEIDWGSL